MNTISVIVPVFNGEKYLIGCLESIAKQTIENIEIIIVENGSDDNSPEIISRFIEEWSDRREILYLVEKQRGNSYARNLGIKYASGEFIAFVDQDDCVKKSFFEYMYKQAKRMDADVITSGYKAVFANGFTKRIMRLPDSEWAPYRMVAPWGKLYKRSLIEENDITFLPVNKGEDVFFVLNAYNHAKNLRVVPVVGYKWFSNSNSFSHTEHRKINDDNSILPLFDVLHQSLYPLKGIRQEYLEYFFIKTIVHETVFCAKGKSLDEAYGYFQRLEEWIDINYPNNKNNKYVALFMPKGEDFKRRFFVLWFWHLKKNKQVKKYLKIYTKIFR